MTKRHNDWWNPLLSSCPQKKCILLGHHLRAHLSICSNWRPWLRAAPEILLNKVIKYHVLKTGKGKMEWKPLVSFVNDYTQPFDALSFNELNGCSMNMLNSVRLWELPEMKVGSCRICWSHIKKKKKKNAGKEKIFWKNSELGFKNAMFQSFMRVILHSLSFHLAWAFKPSLPGGMHLYLQRKGIVQGGSGKNTQRYREKSRDTIHNSHEIMP